MQDLAEEQLGPLVLRVVKNSSGAFCSMIWPASMKMTRSATWRAKPISWVTHEHGHALLGEVDHHVEHLLDHLGVERRGRLVEEHDARVHAERAGDRDALLLAAGELAGIFVAPARGCARASDSSMATSSASRFGHLAHPDRRQRAVLEDGQVRKQVEVLEDHADLAADLVDALEVVGQLDAVDDDAAASGAPRAG